MADMARLYLEDLGVYTRKRGWMIQEVPVVLVREMSFDLLLVIAV
jgi:hypothetical protein